MKKNFLKGRYESIEAQLAAKVITANVEVLNAVLESSPSDKERLFYCREDFWSSSLEKKGTTVKEILSVKTTDFNTLCKKDRPNVLVMDIEGGELNLLQEVNLDNFDKILVELHPSIYGINGSKKIFQTLMEANFAYNTLWPNGQVVGFERV